MDAIATPFVQGQLRQQHLSVTVTTECAVIRHAIHLELDSSLTIRVREAEASPWVYLPLVDFAALKGPSITGSF